MKPQPPKLKGKPCCPATQCCKHTGNPAAGNPISVASGNKYEEVVDVSTAGPDPLRFVRSYNSTLTHDQTTLGWGWRHHLEPRLWFNVTTRAVRPDGRELVFSLVSGVWTPDTDIPDRLTTNGTTWTYTDAQDTQEVYDSAGLLQSITRRNGYQQTLAYDANDQLQTVTDSYGRTLTFTYDKGLLATVTDPDGHVIRYTYDATSSLFSTPNRLIGVTYPDTTPADLSDNPTVTYVYENADFPNALTGIIDERGNRFATFAYDAEGRATMSEHAQGADHVDIVFNTNGTQTVTDAVGQSQVYHFAQVAGASKVTQIDRVATATVPAATQTMTYDANGFLSSRTDWKGTLTTYVHNNQGLETSRTEASGTPQARTITTAWHATWRLPTSIVEPGKTTTFTYTAQGHLQTRTEVDTTGGSTNGETRTWTYTYTPAGQVATVNGPRTDVSDVTTYTYTTAGYLKMTTNALSQVTEVMAHNAHGLPTILKDANGIITHLTYHPRGWLVQTTVKSSQGDATTRFTYDDAGQVVRITRPDGSTLSYEYDDARRVIAVSNGLNERIDYTLDANGNRLSETVKSGTGAMTRTLSRTFDSLNRLLTQVGAASQTTTSTYDANGNRLTQTDPLSHQTQQAFDALNRLVSVTDPATNVATYGYNTQDLLTSVTDQRTLTTTYVYNAFGDVIQQTSPDTGTTTYQTDLAGNRTQETDARGVVTTYTYDALNRVLTRHFSSTPAENIAYTYDATAGGNKGVGRLTGLTDQSGSTTFVYDDRGNVITETRVINTHSATTRYTYDLADQLVQITYPSGRLVSYQRDSQGRVQTVTTQTSSSSPPSVVASAITYQPFGPMASLTYGNGLVLTLTYDQDYRLTGLQAAAGGTVVQNLTYTYNAADNLTLLTDGLTPARTQTLGYDGLNRLTSATGIYGTLGFTYDAVGNRVTRTAGGTTETSTLSGTSNRLLSTTVGGATRSLSYLPNGQIQQDSRSGPDVYDFTYSAQNRLAKVTQNSQDTYQYLYNALGQRVVKDALAGGTDSHAVYDRDGRLLVETDTLGQATKEYVYLDGLPLAVLDPGASGVAPALDLILDNGQTGVTTTGTWTTETAGSGYEGPSYLQHAPSSVIVDNADAGFSVMGAWTTTSAGTGMVGGTYRTRNSASPSLLEVIVDNSDAGFSAVGTWATKSASDDYGVSYRTHGKVGLPAGAVTYDNVHAAFSAPASWLTKTSPGYGYEGSNFRELPSGILPPSALSMTTADPGGSWTGPWINLGSGHRLYYGVASTTDAVTWAPTTLPATPTVYHVYVRWAWGAAPSPNATYTVHHGGGSTVVVKDQAVGADMWSYLATVTMQSGQSHRVELSGQGSGRIRAWKLALVPVDAVSDSATWQPPVAAAGEVGLYTTWVPWSTRHPSAPYTIFMGTARRR